MSTRPRLLFVVNNPAFFLSHRLPLALAAQRAGYDVHVATMAGDSVADIVSHGLTQHVVPMTRSGKNPLQELRTLWALYRLFRQLRPDVVHLVTIKPVLYGGIAARLAGVPAMVSAISGLGFVFVAQGAKAAMIRQVVATLYRLALGHGNSRVVFQNGNDRDVLCGLGAVRDEQVVMIRGSGVALADFPAVDEPPGPVAALMVSRLLRDKGLLEFVEAARLLKQRGTEVRMLLAGGVDPGNPASASQSDVDAWRAEGCIEALGERSDVAALYAQAHIAVLPSYREGLPRSLIEAAACGRAVVTTDVPGCRDAIEPDVTGLLVPARDAQALAYAIVRLASYA
ncbi:glycosyltransferase family 4 protein, partial [Bordetella petrii]|uniref:glycosyltransferase family 4 protein n=1 Tax=Bordetella petrii TaxID=94624 RepID=UPI001E596591